MQQLEIEHEKEKSSITNSKQIVEENKTKDRRPGKGRVLALSRMIYRIQYSDTFYVESERCDNTYYFVKYKPDVIEWCSCMDNSTRGAKCKHIFAVEFAIRMNTLKDIDKLPAEAQRFTNNKEEDPTRPEIQPLHHTKIGKSYTKDDYSF
jgi:hypothetical protein